MIKEKYRKLKEIEFETKQVQNLIKKRFSSDFNNSITFRNYFLTQIARNENCFKIFQEYYKKSSKKINLHIDLNDDLKSITIRSIGYFIRNLKRKIISCELWVGELYNFYKTPLYFRLFDLRVLSISGYNNLTTKDFRALLASYSNEIIFELREDAFSSLVGLEQEDMPNNPKLIFKYKKIGDLKYLMKVKPTIFKNVTEVSFFSYENHIKDRIFRKILCSSIMKYKTKFKRKYQSARGMMARRKPPINMNLEKIFEFIN